MPKITYQSQGLMTFTDMPLNGVLYVFKGTTVSFKLAGLTGGATAMSTSSSFDTVSASMHDVKTVDVTAGSVTMTARVIVFDMEALVTPLDNFVGRSATDLGVDERVNLDIRVTPVGLTAVQVGGIRWVMEGAIGGKNAGTIQKSATEKAPSGNDGKAHYIAPYVTTAMALTFPPNSLTPSPGLLSKSTTLRLEVQSGPSKGKHIRKVFTIHTPQAVMVAAVGNYQHQQNFPSAGFRGYIFLTPKNVSFRTLEWREAGGTAKAWANSAPGVAGGYFIYDHGKTHHPTGTSPSGGSFNTEVRNVDGGSIADGCFIMQVDSVWTGWNGVYPGPYTKGIHSNIATNVASTMVWPIYWQYRVSKGADTGWNTFQKAEHKAEMDGSGSVTISKAGASKTFALADASCQYS